MATIEEKNRIRYGLLLVLFILAMVFLLLKCCSTDSSNPIGVLPSNEDSVELVDIGGIDSLESVGIGKENIDDDANTNRDMDASMPNNVTPPPTATKKEVMENDDMYASDSQNSADYSVNIPYILPNKKDDNLPTSSNQTKHTTNANPKGLTKDSDTDSNVSSMPPPLPYDYNKKSLAIDLMKFKPNIRTKDIMETQKRLQNASNPNFIVFGGFSNGMEQYKLKDYLSHLKSTGPFNIEILDIQKDEEGKITAIKLEETLIDDRKKEDDYQPKNDALASRKFDSTSKVHLPTPYDYSMKSLAADFMKLEPNRTSRQIVELKKRIQNAFASNATITGKFSDGTSQYTLKNYITHLRNTGPYIVKIDDMRKNEEGEIVFIQLKETQID